MDVSTIPLRKGASSMLAPVRCLSCGAIFDLCKGRPVARYADCTVFVTPCCGVTTDDRPPAWAQGAGVERVSHDEAFLDQFQPQILPDGSMRFGRGRL